MKESPISKRVLHIYSSWTAGGAEKLMLSLAAGLEGRGLKNVIACPGDSYMFVRARELGLTAYPLVIKGSFDPFGIAGLASIIRKENIDILHAHQGKVFWPCIFAKWFAPRLRVVFHRHAQLPHAFYSRSHYRWADRVIAISQAVAGGLERGEKVPKEKLRVVYNGTDFERFNPAVPAGGTRERYGLGGKLVIGTVAAMNRPKGKGQEYLIEAARLLKDTFPQAAYLIVGTGPIESKLKELAVAQGVADRVVFTGYQEEVEKFIAAMDVFAFLSWDTEGFGQVMVEAQAMAKPVIGTGVGGIPETFAENVTGIRIPTQDSAALARAIQALLGDAARRREMGDKAARFVREKFSIDAMVNGVLQVYQETENE